MTSQSRDFEISRNLQIFYSTLFQDVKWDHKLIQCAKNHMEIPNRFEDIRKMSLLIKTRFFDFIQNLKTFCVAFFTKRPQKN